jgi:hypothetical protein
VRGVNPEWLPDWVTLQAAGLHLNHQTAFFPTGVRFQFCMVCLEDDLGRADQFIRLDQRQLVLLAGDNYFSLSEVS